MQPQSLEVGEIINGTYRIDGVLGRGGMGVVVAACHLGRGERVAIKFLSARNDDPKAVERFLREGQAAVKLRSDRVARMFEVGTREDGSPFLVMEYLEGQDVAAFLQKNGPVDIELACTIILEVCEAL